MKNVLLAIVLLFASCSKEEGCTATWADNYNSDAEINDGSCYRNGCTDVNAANYDTYATEEDGTCKYKRAEFTIKDVIQKYYSPLDEFGSVEIHYDISNSGNYTIDYYEVWFTIKTTNGSKYTEWTNGTNVAIGKTMSDYTFINTAGKQYKEVSIDSYELTYY